MENSLWLFPALLLECSDGAADVPTTQHPVCNSAYHRLAERRKESGSASDRLRRLEADYDWISREKANFGKGEYDFERQDAAAIYREYEETEKRLKELKEHGGIQRQVWAGVVLLLGCVSQKLIRQLLALCSVIVLTCL